MRTNIRKIGNSAGAIIPALLLKKLNISKGDSIEITEDNHKIIISPCKIKYSLKELLSQCDENAAMPKILNEWEQLSPVGREVL